MARDYAARCPVSPVRNTWLVAAAILLAAQGIGAQKVRVEEELEAYPTESVDLRCQFIDGGGRTKLTQVSWIWEPIDGQRDNIAVYHPIYGQSFPNLSFKDRVVFLQNSLENPSIRISNLKMSDAGRYTCEYATYPSGNEQGTTTLIMLAKPKNSANVVTVQAGSKSVVVAQCEAADGKPAATIKWLTQVGGNHSTSTMNGPDGTVTVRSEYRLVPTPADDGRELTCMVEQRTQERPWTLSVRLSVEYPPSVSIEGYDNNWYVGRSGAVLFCQANANPPPTDVTWTAASGSLPDTVVVDGNKLTVRKVDDAVNTTFICEVKNKHGASRHQITTIVIAERRSCRHEAETSSASRLIWSCSWPPMKIQCSGVHSALFLVSANSRPSSSENYDGSHQLVSPVRCRASQM
ncbi:PVR cell adhesion molecule related 2 like isoform X3 [Acanthopagrus latus]|uniref:PVR cell adhesion molecule related 2 like isoform X3 n=1 Tax=Acanthopagrus latus TaxID=8177 RepID=UPI00187C7B37|nr:PVR cell adhesion molecule related 2 like isoform X3 [Acanthopagrus latus]